jgi:zinc protease
MFRLQTVGGFGGKSDQLNAYNVFLSDPAYFDATSRATACTRRRCRRVAPLSRSARRVTLSIVPHGRARWPRPTRRGGRLVSAAVDRVDRSRLPSPADAAVPFPRSRKSTLPTACACGRAPHAGAAGRVHAAVRRGAASDPAGKDGLAASPPTCSTRAAATARRSRCTRRSRGSARSSTPTSAPTRRSQRHRPQPLRRSALALLSDIVVRPALREATFARVRQLRLHRLTQLRDMPGAVADRAFLKLLYGAHPYGHSPIGSEASLAAMHDDGRAPRFHARRVSAGSVDADCRRRLRPRRDGADGGRGIRGLERRRRRERPDEDRCRRRRRLNIVPRPPRAQSRAADRQVSVPARHARLPSTVVGDTILGGQVVQPASTSPREAKGLTYGARTAFEFPAVRAVVLQVSVQTSGTRGGRSTDRWAEIGRDPRNAAGHADELALGIAALTRGYARSFETGEQIGRAALQLALYDLPDDYFEQFVPRIERVTRDEVSRVMARHLDPARLTTLVVGDLDVIGRSSAPSARRPVVLPPTF